MQVTPRHVFDVPVLLIALACAAPSISAAAPAKRVVRYERGEVQVRVWDGVKAKTRRKRVQDAQKADKPTMTAADFVREKKTAQELAARMEIIDEQIAILKRLIQSHLDERTVELRL